jgi:LmbE family N-acetylglucosaminyl deacetylase
MNCALVVAAHPDDEVLGCGGTVARLVRAGWEVHAMILAEGITSRAPIGSRQHNQGDLELLAGSTQRAAGILGYRSVRIEHLPDNRMDGLDFLDVVKLVESIVEEIKPVRVFTHHGHDLNIDHEITSRAVVTACRPLPGSSVRELLFFETPSSTEWQIGDCARGFLPNVFVNIRDTLDVKLEALAAYVTEIRSFPHPRSTDAVRHLAHWRGATAGFVCAEAFALGRRLED